MAESASDRSQLEVGLVCDGGTSQAGVHGLSDLFRYVGALSSPWLERSPRASIRIAHWTVDDAGDARCTYDSHPGSPHHPSVLVLPGNLQATEAALGDSSLSSWLRTQHAGGVVLAAVCGGVFHLARTGLLDGRRATTHWALTESFTAQFPEVVADTAHMVIDYGDVVTAGGVLAWADLGLRLVERFVGRAAMLDTARYMLVDPPGREQRFYSEFVPKLHHGDDVILDVQRWLAAQGYRPVQVSALAGRACLEPRTFLRRFVRATGLRPSEYQLRLRIDRARELLEWPRGRIDAIASRVGYEDPRAFRRVFRKVTGLTPSEYRRRFGGPNVSDQAAERNSVAPEPHDIAHASEHTAARPHAAG